MKNVSLLECRLVKINITFYYQANNRALLYLDNNGLPWTVFAPDKVTAVPVRWNGNFQTPISVPAVRPKRCHTLSNPAHRQDYTVACLNYTLQTMMPLPGWPVMAPNAYDNNNIRQIKRQANSRDTLTSRPRSLISPMHCAMTHSNDCGASLSGGAVRCRKLCGLPHFNCRLLRHFLWHEIPHCTHRHMHCTHHDHGYQNIITEYTNSKFYTTK